VLASSCSQSVPCFLFFDFLSIAVVTAAAASCVTVFCDAYHEAFNERLPETMRALETPLAPNGSG
jgi:hypothetical protein